MTSKSVVKLVLYSSCVCCTRLEMESFKVLVFCVFEE